MKKILSVILSIILALVLPLSVMAGGLPENAVDGTPVEIMSSFSNAEEPLALGATPTVGKTYNLRTLVSTTAYLNVWGGIDADGTRVDMWAKDGSTEQKFKLISGTTSGTYRLQAVCSSSNRVVDAYSSTRPIQSGASADIWLPNDAAAQNLSIVKVGASSYKIVLSSYSTLALTAVSTSNDGAVKFNTYTGANNQLWYFEEVGSSSSSYLDFGWLNPFYSTSVYTFTQGYNSNHRGIDLGAAFQTPLRAAASGKAIHVYYELNGSSGNENDGYGYAIAFETNNRDPGTNKKLIAIYEHLYERPKINGVTNIAVGDSFSAGTQIGKVGSTGNSTGPHLHFEINKVGSWYNGQDYETVNPLLFYPSGTFSNSSVSVYSSNPCCGTVKDQSRLVDIALIDYIGEELFLNWVANGQKAEKEMTVQQLMADFNISQETYVQITGRTLF